MRRPGCLAGCLGDTTGFRALSHDFSMGYSFRRTPSSRESRCVLSSGVLLEAESCFVERAGVSPKAGRWEPDSMSAREKRASLPYSSARASFPPADLTALL